MLVHIFRVRCEQNDQNSLFASSTSPATAIIEAIQSKPTASSKRGSDWHIGSVEKTSTGEIAFQIGRSLPASMPKYDEQEREFFEEKDKRSPFTLAVFVPELQVCGVLKKTGVSGDPVEFAHNLERLLNSTPVPDKYNLKIHVSVLLDPSNFIEILMGSFKVTRFRFIAVFKNAFDTDKLIQEPAQRLNQLAKGNETSVEVKGDDLNKDLLGELARGVASVGDQADATIRKTSSSKSQNIRLSGSPVSEPLLGDENQDLLGRIVATVRDAYNRIRAANQ